MWSELPDEERQAKMDNYLEWNGCNHSTYCSANPDCQICRSMYGRIPESPAFTGSWFEKKLLLLVAWLRRRREGH